MRQDTVLYGVHECLIEPGHSQYEIREALEFTAPSAIRASCRVEVKPDGTNLWIFDHWDAPADRNRIDAIMQVAATRLKKTEYTGQESGAFQVKSQQPKLTPIEVPVLTKIEEDPWTKPRKNRAPPRKRTTKSTTTSQEVQPMSETKPAQVATQVTAPIEQDTRMAQVMRGMKEGALKKAFDALISKISEPIAVKIAESFKGMGPNTELVVPAIQLCVEFIFMMGTAEVVNFLGPQLGKVMPGGNDTSSVEKSRLLSIWMRKYAGEKVGAQIVEAAVQYLPLVLDGFQQFSAEDIKIALGNDAPIDSTPAPVKAEYKVEI